MEDTAGKVHVKEIVYIIYVSSPDVKLYYFIIYSTQKFHYFLSVYKIVREFRLVTAGFGTRPYQFKWKSGTNKFLVPDLQATKYNLVRSTSFKLLTHINASNI